MMRPIEQIERGRILDGYYASRRGQAHGAFRLHGPSGRELVILSSGIGDGTGWEHVSVSTAKHIPNWTEMCWVKSLFWEDEDCVVQFHPPASSYVNCHPHTLHLWRWTRGEFPMPPPILVGPPTSHTRENEHGTRRLPTETTPDCR